MDHFMSSLTEFFGSRDYLIIQGNVTLYTMFFVTWYSWSRYPKVRNISGLWILVLLGAALISPSVPLVLVLGAAYCAVCVVCWILWFFYCPGRATSYAAWKFGMQQEEEVSQGRAVDESRLLPPRGKSQIEVVDKKAP
ncbi:hypothetical protein V8F33_012123 [Rhypophila sp. PSN 637]